MDTQADKMLDTFVAQNGTIKDWDGDRSEWLTAFGFWCGGWYACQKSAQHVDQSDVPSSAEPSSIEQPASTDVARG